MKQYHDMLKHILANGVQKGDRTGTGTVSTFGNQMRFDLSKGFPLLTTKKMYWKGVVQELQWFISGSTNTNDLPENLRHWWTPWADSDGNLGPIYGEQLRKWKSYELDGDFGTALKRIDQLKNIIERIKTNPDCRRLIISLWNVGEIDKMKLPPCHGNIIQFYVSNGRLSCQMYQRSADFFIGSPVNIASYALLVHMITMITDLAPGDFIYTTGDTHLYLNHQEQVREQLSREPKSLPTLRIVYSVGKKPQVIDDFVSMPVDNFIIENYEPWPAIKAPLAV